MSNTLAVKQLSPRAGTSRPVMGITPAGKRYVFPSVLHAVQALPCSESALRKVLRPAAVAVGHVMLGGWRWAYVPDVATANTARDYTEMTLADLATFVLNERPCTLARRRPRQAHQQPTSPVYTLRESLDAGERARLLEERRQADADRVRRAGVPGAVYRFGYLRDGFPMCCPVCGRIVVPDSNGRTLLRHFEACTSAADIPADRLDVFYDGTIRLRVDGWQVPARPAAGIQATKCQACPYYNRRAGNGCAASLCIYKHSNNPITNNDTH